MKSLNALKTFGFAWLQLMKDHFDLFLLESKLSKMSIIPFIITSVLCCILVFFVWMCLLVLIGYGVYSFDENLLYAILAPLLLNIVFLIIGVFIARGYAKTIGFRKTRRHWRKYQRLKLEWKNDQNRTQD